MLDKIQDIFGERISVHRNVDGSVNVAFKASDNGATINALLSLGSQISLIEPEHAKNRYLDELARILKNYGK